MSYHVPVLLQEVLDLLKPQPGENLIDCTLGGGGHAAEILKRTAPDGKLLGIDADPDAIKFAAQFITATSQISADRIRLVNDNFVNFSSIVQANRFAPVQMVLLDLGVSSAQIDIAAKGFSFTNDGPLNMTFLGGSKRQKNKDAAEVINKYPKQKLKEIFKKYGDIKESGDIARKIIERREQKNITTTSMLVEAILGTPSRRYSRDGVNPALSPYHAKLLARVFQAIRIEVNDELENLQAALPQIITELAPGGRLAVIAYHSGEDRIVKHLFREQAKTCLCPPRLPLCRCGHVPQIKLITRKVVRSSAQEINQNPRARSACLRVVQKIN